MIIIMIMMEYSAKLLYIVKCQPCTTKTAPAPTNAQKTDRHIIYKKRT